MADRPRPARRWRDLLLASPDRRRPGTMPAGLVLVVVVAGLLLATALNAEATLRKSRAQGESFRSDVAAVVESVASPFGLTAPRRWADEALGRSTGAGPSVDELLAEQRELAARREQEAAAAGTTTTLPTRPVLRTPTPDDPLRLWVGGDSVAGSFGVQLQPIAASTGLFDATLDYEIGTGLVRSDFYNWPEHFTRDVVPSLDPDVMVLMFGANDDQDFVVDGRNVPKFSPEWYVEYRRRVAATMDLLASPDNDRLVVWVGAVPAGPGSNISNMDVLNYIYWDEARRRWWVTYVDTFALLGGDDQTFAKEVVYADGQRRGPYQKDNLHLSTWGAQRLAWGTLAHIGRFVDLSATAVPQPPPSETAPPEVRERDELPVPPGGVP